MSLMHAWEYKYGLHREVRRRFRVISVCDKSISHSVMGMPGSLVAKLDKINVQIGLAATFYRLFLGKTS